MKCQFLINGIPFATVLFFFQKNAAPTIIKKKMKAIRFHAHHSLKRLATHLRSSHFQEDPKFDLDFSTERSPIWIIHIIVDCEPNSNCFVPKQRYPRG